MTEHKTMLVANKRESYTKIRFKYQTAANAARSDFLTVIYPQFRNMDKLHDDCDNKVSDYLFKNINDAITDLVSFGVHDVDDEYFYSEYLQKYISWEDDFQKIDDQYLEIALKSDELDQYRTARRQNRGRWVGGGFGIGGAIKGATQAAALNAVSGIAHGVWNLGAKAVSSSEALSKKKKLYESDDTKYHLANAVYDLIFSIHLGVIDAISEKHPEIKQQMPTSDEIDKSLRLFENIKKGRVQGDKLQDITTECINLNPYNPDFYIYWLHKWGDFDKSLEKTSLHFGLDIISKEKDSMIQKRDSELSWESTTEFTESIKVVRELAQKIGYGSLPDYEIIKQKEIENSELSKRTFKSVTYETPEEAEKAKVDHESRTVNGKTFDSVDEADTERSKKRVGWALGLGILCLPYIFSFFTLRKGYSSTARAISIGWLLLMVGFRYSTGTHPEQPAHSSEASAVASATPANNPVDEIPFVGKRTFNFYGGTGTQMSIEIQKSGTAKVESYGTSGTLVDFSGKFSNPLPINKTNSLLFKDKKVFLTKSDGTIEKGCSGDDNVTCESELFSE